MANFPTAGNDTIDGTNGKDTIDALGGDDVINGFGGNDILRGSGGDDDITGGTGNDNLYGLAGTDTARYQNTTVQAASTSPAVLGTWAGALLTLTTGTIDGTDVLNAFEKLWMNGVMFDVNVSAHNVVAITGADTANASEDGPNVLGNVLANDYDIDSQLSVTGISFDGTLGTVGVAIAGDFGSLTINSDGTYSYDPAPDSTGTDVFTYTVLDGGLARNVTLTVNVVAVNDPPVANDSTNSGDEDTEIQGTVTATDPDSVPTFAVDTGPSHGVLVLQPDGTYTYTPDANYHGSDSFTFTASDGTLIDVGQVDLTINSVPNDTLVVGAGGYATIQEAIDAAEAGDTIQITAGTYSENVLVNKSGITIVGIGEVNLVGTFKTDNGIGGDVNSWLETATSYDNASGMAFTVTANDVSISNINIDSYYIGVETVGDLTGLSLTDVDVSNGIFGLHKELVNGSLDGVTVTGGSFSNLHIGIDFEKDPNVAGNDVLNFTLDGTHFEDITAKGFYAETLTNGHLTNFTMTNVGYFGGTPSFGGFAGSGIELNLKKGTYSGIEIDHFTMTNVGQSTRFGAPHDNAAAISIKPRDDSAGNSPVSITDVVRIHDGVIDGTSTGIRNGETNRTNQTGDFEIENVVITGAVQNAQNGDIESRSAANIEVIGSAQADSWYVSAQSIGTITFDLGDGADTVNGGTSTGALAIDGGDGNDSLTGGAGNDSITGGAGDDTIVGGGGTDTAHYGVELTAEDFDGTGGAFSVSAGADGTDSLGVERVVDASGDVFWLVSTGGSINAAIAAASAGETILVAEGSYSENVVVNKSGLTLVGLGEVTIQGTLKSDNGLADGDSVATFLQTATGPNYASGAGLTIEANDVVVRNFNIDDFNRAVQIGNSSNVTLEDLDLTGFVVGYRKSTEANSDGLSIIGGSVSDGELGLSFFKTLDNANGTVDNLLIDGTDFFDLNEKGVYFESLENSQIINITMANVGNFGRGQTFGAPLGSFGAGIDINLKDGEYSNVLISDFVFTNVGLSAGGGTSHAAGAAISIKARDDAPSYDAPDAATWVGSPLVIQNGVIDGTATGIHIGEAGKTVGGPAVSVVNVTIDNAVHNSVHGDLANLTSSQVSFTATDGDDSLTLDPHSSGAIVVDLGDGADSIDGGTSVGVLTIDGGDGNDSLTGGSGNDSLTGGEGADTLVGGLGVDTAHYEADIDLGDISYAGGVFSLDADGGDTLDGVERVVDGTGEVFWLVEAGGSIQAAINGAAAGDTIVVAEGVYTESLTITGKPLNFQALGDVTITASAAGSTVLVTGAFAGGDLSFDGFTIAGSNGASIIAGGLYVNATGMGELSFTNGAFEGNAYTGLYVYNSGIDQLTVTDSVFDNNGETGLNSGAQIKLIGLQGDALLQNLTLNGNVGGPDVPNSADRPDYGLEIHGTENALLATEDTVPIGSVTIDNVVITGDFHKSGLAINNYQNLDGLTITDVDLSGATADWAGSGTSVLNVDGIRESYDASAWDVTLPVQPRATSLRGEHNSESPAGQTITGTSSADQMWGNGGDDLLIGEAGDDLIDGQAGTDTVRISGLSTAATAVQAGAVLTVTSADGIDVLTAVEAIEFTDRTVTVTNGNAVLIDADDVASVSEGDAVNGNVLADVFDLDADTVTVTALLDQNGDAVTPNGQGRFVVAATHGFLTLNPDGSYTYTATDPSLSAGQVVTEVFTYTASDGADTTTHTLTVSVTGESNPIIGTGAANTLNGGAYDDVIFGLGGNDILNGNDGADYLDGGSGNDQLNGGSGADEMAGGTGNDTYWVDNAGDVVTEEDGGGTDAVNASVNFILSSFVENLTLSGGDDLSGTGNALNNSLNGNSGNNTLYGLAGNDIMRGGGGADTIVGGVGNDQMWGDAGADRFVAVNESVLTSGTREADSIRDFSAALGDVLDLSAIDANINVGGDQAFTVVGAFSNVAGQLVVVVGGGSTQLRMDVNGDGVEDYRITLQGNSETPVILTGGEPDGTGGWIL